MTFTTIPPEFLEKLLTYLDLDTVKALRLTDKKLAGRCIGPRFLSSIQQPVLDVTMHNLQSFHALACNPALSTKIHSLIFVATSLDSSELEENVESETHTLVEYNPPFISKTTEEYTPEELANARSDLNWLKEQQKARAEESTSDMTEILQLALKGQWYPLWIRASHIFSLVATAIAQSGVPLKQLNVYRRTSRCCIPSEHITTFVSSLSPEQLWILTKGLESLDLIMESIARVTELPSLEKCAFSGLPAKGESILLFLQKHPDLRSFTLHECALTSGSWTPLENLSLSNLRGKHMQNTKYSWQRTHSHSNDEEPEGEEEEQEVDELVNLHPIWDSDRPARGTYFSAGNTRGPRVHTRSFNREELKKGLVFRAIVGRGRNPGSPELYRWNVSREAIYGIINKLN
ncbi:hypothetical protein BJX96DRAFT_169866 [Aspergillus floccosus]